MDRNNTGNYKKKNGDIGVFLEQCPVSSHLLCVYWEAAVLGGHGGFLVIAAGVCHGVRQLPDAHWLEWFMFPETGVKYEAFKEEI